MYDVPAVEDDDQSVSIYRFMVDKDHQGKGYGRAALTQGDRGDPGDSRDRQDHDLLCARQRQGEAFLRQLRLCRTRPARKATGSWSPRSCCERRRRSRAGGRRCKSLAVPGVRVGHRVIQPGDEKVLVRDRSENRHLAGAGQAPRQRRRAHCRAGAAERAWRCGTSDPQARVRRAALAGRRHRLVRA